MAMTPTSNHTPLDAAISVATSPLGSFALHCERLITVRGEDGSVPPQEVVYRVEPVTNSRQVDPPLRRHALDDIQSVVDFAQRYGRSEHSLIFFDDHGVVVVLDELPEEGLRENATLRWRFSREWQHWSKMFEAQGLTHRELLRNLLRLQHMLSDSAVVARMRSASANIVVKQGSDLRDMGEEVGVVVESSGGNDLIQFPRAFEITVPILDDHVDEEHLWVQVQVQLEITLPTKPGEHLAFSLIAPKAHLAVREAIENEVQGLKDSLEGWTILRGRHGETPCEYMPVVTNKG